MVTFGQPLYAVRRRLAWFDPFGWAPAVYDVTSLPPLSSERFSLDWRSGVLRRECDDAIAFSIERGEGTLLRRTCVVREGRDGAVLGSMCPVGRDWELRDPSGHSYARLAAIEEQRRSARYVATASDHVLCQYTWGFLGLTAFSAEMQIEFADDDQGILNRPLAIAAGIVLERRARSVSYRYQ